MLFNRFHIPNRFRPIGSVEATPLQDDELAIRWLGTAGYALQYAGSRLLIDPFLSRPSLPRIALSRLQVDGEAIDRFVSGADFIVCGHSHFDHAMDVPEISKRFGATVIGSASTSALCEASGVAAARRIEVSPEGGRFECGPFRITFVPSLHGRIFGNVPAPGTIPPSTSLPARVWHYRMGGAFGILVEAGPHRVYHNGSADLIDAEIEGHRADVLLVGLALRRATPDYLRRLTRLLEPRLAVPTHYDAFFEPLGRPLRLLPGVDMRGFFEEVATVAPDMALVLPYPLEELRLPPTGPPVLFPMPKPTPR